MRGKRSGSSVHLRAAVGPQLLQGLQLQVPKGFGIRIDGTLRHNSEKAFCNRKKAAAID